MMGNFLKVDEAMRVYDNRFVFGVRTCIKGFCENRRASMKTVD